MLDRALPQSLFIGSLVSILMQMTCMWPVAVLSRELQLSAHHILYASAGILLACNALALPLMRRRTATSQPNLTVCLVACLAAGSLAAQTAALLLVSSATKSFFQTRLAAMGQAELNAVLSRYLDGGDTVNCIAWPGCSGELAGHMRVLLLSTVFYNALACLLLVANVCLIVRALLVSKWQLAEGEAAAAASEATLTTTSTAEVGTPTDGDDPERGATAVTSAGRHPISSVWLAIH